MTSVISLARAASPASEATDAVPTPPTVSTVPAWVVALPGLESTLEKPWTVEGDVEGDFETRCSVGTHFALTSVRVRNARELDEEAFAAAAEAAYGWLLDHLPALDAPYPIRIWNVIPGLLQPLGRLPQRYMVFNRSRFRAFASRSGHRFETYLPTATGVGNDVSGADLVVHCLSSDRSGRPLENPRQVPAYRYSERFGPRPPCFARATVIDVHPSDGAEPLEPTPERSERLLIGGTASVRGEESLHLGDLDAQLVETETNLRALAAQVTGRGTNGNGDAWHGHFAHLRVYHRRPEDEAIVRRFVEDRLPSNHNAEFFCVDICRGELLTEIEGVFVPE